MDEENHALRRHQRVEFSFEDVAYKVPSSDRKKGYKSLLKGVSGHFRSAELTGILGPSGAGKTTLVQVLAGYKIRNVCGKIKVNGEDRNPRTFRKLSCFIMANEELLPHLTVLECMMVAANLKLPEKTPMKTKEATVDEILAKLGLTDHNNTRIHQLSGGQRKRLSIAQELVNNPPLMFLDEPTSGLDSQSCMQCIGLLKALAMDGRTIVCTIHQPSAKLFEMFDQIYIMADGAFIYKGPVPRLIPYLNSQGLECPAYHNPADFVIEVACGEHGDVAERLANCVRFGVYGELDSVDAVPTGQQAVAIAAHDQALPGQRIAEYTGQVDLVDCVDEEARRVNNIHEPTSTVSYSNGSCKLCLSDRQTDTRQRHLGKYQSFTAASFTQFTVLVARTFKCMIRDTYLMYLRLFAHISVGVLIGTLYFGVGNDATRTLNNIGYLFFSLLFMVFTAMMSTIVTFPLEVAVFTREHLNCWYSLKSYYFAKSMADVPFQVLFPLVYSTITYWMTDQPRDAIRFLLYLLLSVLISLTAQSLGLLIGAGTSLQVAVFLGPAVTIPILLFSGFFVTFDTIPSYLRWLTYLSYIRYAYEGTLLSIYGLRRSQLSCQDVTNVLCMMKEPEFILEALGVKEAKLWLDVLILTGFFIAFRLSCYFVLRWRVRSCK